MNRYSGIICRQLGGGHRDRAATVMVSLTAQRPAFASSCPSHGQTLESSAGSPAALSPPARTEKRNI